MGNFILKRTSSLGNLIIKEVPKKLAKKMIIENHYSHKWNDGGFGKYNFGIFKEDDIETCLGVAVYGYMKNSKARIFTHPNPDAWMCELNRMWIDDILGHNSESILIAASIKLLRRLDINCVAVQSFADGRLGCGTIYKAANFKYYGFHYTKFLRNKRTGEYVHEQLFTNTTSPTGYLRNNISFLIGDLEIYRVRTYRYIFPLCKKFKFNRQELSYPDYNKGIDLCEWKRDKGKIKENIIHLLDKVAA
ncbi:Mom family adenine methylcarbamoylation protein [Marinifilum flexuosum]|uniref:Uncharacterized protein n=1 Tax=Marinifilum flexuosum TaxID=1117708 RepID=A0A419X3W5_9BACT|nr:hypothetical protein [Marinifilum flexuosum]RKE02299.1 hypothetical protein BXY64_2387 [Marinifilum flexuosum]